MKCQAHVVFAVMLLGMMLEGCAPVDPRISIQNRSGGTLLVHEGISGTDIRLREGKTADNLHDAVELSIRDEHGARWTYPKINMLDDTKFDWSWLRNPLRTTFVIKIQLQFAILKDGVICVLKPGHWGSKLDVTKQPPGFPMHPAISH